MSAASRRRLKALPALLFLLCGSTLSTAAVPDTERDKLLWCASAFNWLARAADDAADAEGAEIFDAWATRFTELGSAALREAGFGAAQIETALSRYDEEVLDEMKISTMRYEVETCPELLPAAQ